MVATTQYILVVDDEPEIQRLIQQRFRKKIQKGLFEFQFANNGVEALELLQRSSEIDMVLTDIRMPDMDGLTLLEKISEIKHPSKTVVVSAYSDMRNIRTAMNRGAFDFLTKPLNFEDLELTINKTLDCVSYLKEEQRKLQDALDHLRYLAFNDQLTGLRNRNGFLQELTNFLKTRPAEVTFAVLLIELENYNTVKAAFGHRLSDQLLIETAHRLQHWSSPLEILASLEKSEFAVLLQSPASSVAIEHRIQQLRQILATQVCLESITLTWKIKIGIACWDLGFEQAEDYLNAADAALNVIRGETMISSAVFNASMQQAIVERLNLEVDLQNAIANQELRLHYQPIYDLVSGNLVGFEALIRWEHPNRGTISPLQFIPLAEETSLILTLGEWILDTACQQLQQWKAQFGRNCPDQMHINLSGWQLMNSALLEQVDQILLRTGLRGENLYLEITETVLMKNIHRVREVLNELRQRGIKISIDDFGTGYSSLSYLQVLPITSVKIDRSFIQHIETNSIDYDITATIISLAHHLALNVVAEGVETNTQQIMLRNLSCNYGQGFHFARPLIADDAAKLIDSNSN